MCQFRTFSKKDWSFGNQFLAGFPKLHSTSSAERFGEKYQLNRHNFLSVSKIQQKNRTFSETILAGLSQLQPTFSGECFGEVDNFSQKHSYFYNFRIFSKILSNPWRTFTVGFWKLNSECPEERFWEKNSHRKSFLIVFGLCAIWFR